MVLSKSLLQRLWHNKNSSDLTSAFSNPFSLQLMDSRQRLKMPSVNSFFQDFQENYLDIALLSYRDHKNGIND